MVVRRTLWLPLLLSIVNCGYSEQEWQVQLDRLHRKEASEQVLSDKVRKLEDQLASAQKDAQSLANELRAAGVDISKLHQDLEASSTRVSSLSATLEEREKALAEYRSRAKQLEAIKLRFETLRSKLNELTNIGLTVNVRRNRMVISLPGDVLFDTAKDTLSKEGRDILAKIGSVLKGDPSLLARDYQVAGHTDNQPLSGGKFQDNWGLSLMRARAVLLYLVNQAGLPSEHLSAAGFADTDPVAGNDTSEGRQKNRRCELIAVPSVEEMLDLQAIAR